MRDVSSSTALPVALVPSVVILTDSRCHSSSFLIYGSSLLFTFAKSSSTSALSMVSRETFVIFAVLNRGFLFILLFRSAISSSSSSLSNSSLAFSSYKGCIRDFSEFIFISFSLAFKYRLMASVFSSYNPPSSLIEAWYSGTISCNFFIYSRLSSTLKFVSCMAFVRLFIWSFSCCKVAETSDSILLKFACASLASFSFLVNW